MKINEQYDKNRNIWITKHFDEELFEDVGPKLAELVKGKEPINIYIISCGGECDIGMAIIDLIEIANCKVRTINIGRAYSMGFMVLIAGHERYSMPNSPMMLHEFGTKMRGQYTQLKSYAEFLDQLQDYFIRHIKKYSNIKDGKRVEELLHREKWIYPPEALSFGFIDKIIKKEW